jgi:hypothetical protein
LRRLPSSGTLDGGLQINIMKTMLTECGTMQIGHCHQTRSFIGILDEGGLIWNGRRSHRSLDAALADAEAGVARWMEDELGMKAATQT